MTDIAKALADVGTLWATTVYRELQKQSEASITR